jgi:hypothetical protein
MAEDSDPRSNDEMTGSTTPRDMDLKVNWDDSNMRSVYANVCNVAGTREEIVLLFGMNQAWHSEQKEVTVHLTDRVVLSPYAAKRLSLLLNNVVGSYESRYGALDIESQRQARASVQ